MIHILSSMLIVYIWVVAAFLILFLFLIGRFYEIRFGQKSYYQLFLIPLGLLIIGAIWDAFFANTYTGNPLLDFAGGFWPNLFFLIGGIVLTVLCYALYRTMMGRRG